MAESHFPPLGPCITYSVLVERNCVASSQYCRALSELSFLAGKQQRARFAEAKRQCENCLRNCKRTMEEIRAHRAAHGC